MVATAASTYISGSQFTFKWNFNIGERRHTGTFVYVKTVFSSEEQCTRSQSAETETTQTSGDMFVFSIIYLPADAVGKDGEGGGGRGGSMGQACQLSSSWRSVISVSDPLFGAWGANFLGRKGGR